MKKILLIFTLFLITGSLVMSQTVQITGTVSSAEDGLALPGVNVTVKGTTIGAITDTNGRYTLSAPANAQALTFSFVGYRTIEIPIAGKTRIDAVLQQDIFNVEEVVVVAYGTQQKRDITGSVASVNLDAIKDVPVQSFDQALQGKAAGVAITLPNGVLNNPPVIRIRGYNSISGSSYPLVVVDGVPIATGNWGGNAATNALADINPADIASMDILKDASATALYGSRAANGVIIITTKRGSGARTKVTYDGYVGMTEAYHLFDMMNANQYIEHKNKAWVNLLGATAPKLTQLNDANGKPIDTNWADQVYQKGLQQNHAVSFSGSTPTTSYFLSVGYTDQNGMVKKNTYTRKNARLNLDHKLNRYISLGANIAYTNGHNEAPNTGASFATAGAARLAFVLPPIIAPYKNDGSGDYNIEGSAIGRMGEPFPALGYYNPVAIMNLCKYTTETDRLLANVYASIEPVKGLILKSAFGMDNLTSEQTYFQSPVTGDGYGSNGAAGARNEKFRRWTWTNTANYNVTLKELYNIGLLAGVEEQRSTDTWWGGDKTNVTDPFFKVYQGAWVTAGMGGGGLGENYFLSYFGRASFNYNRKYYVEGSVRRDGFSGLAKGNKFGTFGGASVMWNASNEEFINNALGSIFSDIRLKASFGRVGNISAVGDFSSLFLYGAGVYGAVPTLNFTQAGNADLKWETSDKYDLGLSFGLFKDKIQAEINYFYNDINGLVLGVPQSPSKGIPDNSISANVGSMFNKGLEISITSFNIAKPNFSWTTTLNFSTLKNEVTALAPGVTELLGVTGGLETTSKTVIGKPIGNILAVETRGVDPETGRRIYVNNAGKEVLFYFENSSATRWQFRDGSGVSPAITTAADAKVMGSPLPKYYGGFDNTLAFKNIDFSLNLTYAIGFDLYNGSKAGLRDQRWWNNSVEVYETAWEQPGDITNIPKPVMNDNISNGSSFPITENIEKGGYVKVRNISLGYSFKKLPSITSIESIRLYAQVFNAYVFTNYTGSDPEVSTNGNANLTPGIDRNTAPQARIYTLGLSVNF
jgi:TonB-dependent starch-binding outer membrane protein SusC